MISPNKSKKALPPPCSKQPDKAPKCVCFDDGEFNKYHEPQVSEMREFTTSFATSKMGDMTKENKRKKILLYSHCCLTREHSEREKEYLQRYRKAPLGLPSYRSAASAHRQLLNEQSFPQFRRLPIEIQLRIWNFSLPGPEIITLLVQGQLDSPKLRVSRASRNPAALYVCRASREIALKRYRLSLGSRKIYANLSGQGCDILRFEGNDRFGSALSFIKEAGTNDSAQSAIKEILNAQRIAINWYDREACGGTSLGYLGKTGSRMRKELSELFVNLKEVLLTGAGIESGTFQLPGRMSSEVRSDEDFREEASGGKVQWWSPNTLQSRVEILAHGFNMDDMSDEEKTNGIPKAIVALDLC